MGAVHLGIPREHVETLKALGGYAGLFETGTYRGDTAAWAASVFPAVHTVEASPRLFERAREQLAPLRNVVQHLGRSTETLRSLVPGLAGPWLFWLDAHWSAGETFGEGEECPLLAELEVVLRAGPHTVLVDDARLFFAPQGAPHDWRQWPTIDQICTAVREHSRGHVSMTVVDDVIFCLPRAVHERWCEHLQARATRARAEAAAAPPRKRGIAGWFGRRER